MLRRSNDRREDHDGGHYEAFLCALPFGRLHLSSITGYDSHTGKLKLQSERRFHFVEGVP